MLLHKTSGFHACLWKNLFVYVVTLFCPRGKIETTYFYFFVTDSLITSRLSESCGRYFGKLRAAAVITEGYDYLASYILSQIKITL